MPVFRLSEELAFPNPALARRDGLLAVGGDLSAERLVLAYSNGIFPWFSEDDPILWWSPPVRPVVNPADVRVPRSLAKAIRRKPYEIRLDTHFTDVVRACARAPRPGQSGTWITPEMRDAYVGLHALGIAHCAEAWAEDKLVGGLYGVCLGGAFFGESMFAKAPDASKVAFVTLCAQLARWGVELIDSQVTNEHTERFGTTEIPRAEFLARLRELVRRPMRQGPWTLDADLAQGGLPEKAGAGASGD